MPDQARFLSFMDMIDGGGAGTYGDKFEDGGIFSALANLVATPYGSEDAGRRAKREAAYRAAGLLAPEEAEAAPAAAPTVTRGGTDISNLRPQLRPDNFMTEAQKEQVVMNQPVGNGYPDMSMPAIAGYTTPAAPVSDYPNMNMPAIAGYTAPFTAQMTQPSALSGGIVQPVPIPSAEGANSLPATPAPIVKGPNLYPSTGGSDISMPPFSANPPSAAAMTPPTPLPEDRNPQLAAFNQAMSTVPQMMQGTQIEQMYRDYLLNGGAGTFAQFTGAQ